MNATYTLKIDHTDLAIAQARADEASSTTDEAWYVFDGIWQGQRFLHLIPRRWLEPVDHPHLVYRSVGGKGEVLMNMSEGEGS